MSAWRCHSSVSGELRCSAKGKAGEIVGLTLSLSKQQGNRIDQSEATQMYQSESTAGTGNHSCSNEFSRSLAQSPIFSLLVTTISFPHPCPLHRRLTFRSANQTCVQHFAMALQPFHSRIIVADVAVKLQQTD